MQRGFVGCVDKSVAARWRPRRNLAWRSVAQSSVAQSSVRLFVEPGEKPPQAGAGRAEHRRVDARVPVLAVFAGPNRRAIIVVARLQ
ncbi:MAG TPA: hypothetical protein VFU81_13760, partial [Thermomicrobiales bacterium]|nr:hypothetical protein [Thermomicrobiales bacterium]